MLFNTILKYFTYRWFSNVREFLVKIDVPQNFTNRFVEEMVAELKRK
jgi:hypothetical protein